MSTLMNQHEWVDTGGLTLSDRHERINMDRHEWSTSIVQYQCSLTFDMNGRHAIDVDGSTFLESHSRLINIFFISTCGYIFARIRIGEITQTSTVMVTSSCFIVTNDHNDVQSIPFTSSVTIDSHTHSNAYHYLHVSLLGSV